MGMERKDVARWARGHRLAARKIAAEATRERLPLGRALARVEGLRSAADALGARASRSRAERENLAFHLEWARVRRAFGFV